MAEANEKGAVLEGAAKAIEEIVIRSHPGTQLAKNLALALDGSAKSDAQTKHYEVF
jgi:hypothetical protein